VLISVFKVLVLDGGVFSLTKSAAKFLLSGYQKLKITFVQNTTFICSTFKSMLNTTATTYLDHWSTFNAQLLSVVYLTTGKHSLHNNDIPESFNKKPK